MEDLLRPIFQERAGNASTLGIVIIEKTKPNSPITDNFDVILLIIVDESESEWQEKHYEFDGKIAAMHTVTEKLLMEWIDTSGYRKAVEWIIDGKVIFDRNEYLSQLKDQLRNFPHEKRDLRKAMEFGKLVKSYSEVKDLYASEQYKDAYSRMVHSLHYLARLAVIEKGYHPEVTLWNQVRQIDPEVYKLYDELIQSDEAISKRLQLMIIASDFVISTRAEVSAKHLLCIMETKEDGWSHGELKQNGKVSPYQLDLTAMLSYLTEKGILIAERIQTKGAGVYQREYRIND
ncbi:Nucleotidyltransferase-like [Virgibacillus subterraneus]|uniref:Nucleotidyltransferase-like n=2 Tax=Virgibacillus TaxID=84406 RepID=A0A1H1G6T2_9BACI|nr:MULTISPECIES: nucleotidyltransferase-like protein [Virgibacillus]SDR08890.1 Nucleotidyltransferase-like [Virgibacillus salinus]SER05657.1 Nucleotidyltransferase-like [Virgibacillus subterraneus]